MFGATKVQTMAKVVLDNSIITDDKVEMGIYSGFAIGTVFVLLHAIFGKGAIKKGGRTAKVFVELQRKAFHMIGGCLLASAYHWGLKYNYLSSAYVADTTDLAAADKDGYRPFDAGAAYISLCFISWIIEGSRLMIPSVQQWYLNSFKGLVRDKELNKAAGIAYFLPGILAAMLAGPPNVAIFGILCLSIGDAAASLGTAAGSIPVGCSARKVEGSIGCFAVCSLIGMLMGLPAQIAVTASALVTFGEILAEVIGLDDNLVIPMLGVLGVRIALAPQFTAMAVVMGIGLSCGAGLGILVGATTNQHQARK